MWIVLMLVYFVFYVATINVIFAPTEFAWFYSPYVGYLDELDDDVCDVFSLKK
jgi:hypothetical protein